ncbi:MAG: site-specific DNA-methyltransferase [Rikenellaceae bacterium]
MHNLKLLEELYKLLRMESRYCSEDGVLLKNSIVESALALRPDLIKLLLSHEGIKSNFFTDVEGIMVFDKIRFQKFVMNKRFLPDSYTSFKNKIGLTGDDGDFLADSREVVLSWPYKDCVLEGGQTKEDAKRNEVFWNEILAPDEINRLTEPKALASFARYDSDGKHEVSEITADDNLIIKGNNLLVLHSLLKSYRGKVKLIYIDPPYNTGNDGFQYNDSFNHSSWLTFMRNRLTVARELLRKDGTIFVQCDDNEQAYLKVLMDDVFNKHNFIQMIEIKMNEGAANEFQNPFMPKNCEYGLYYARNYNSRKYKPIWIERDYDSAYNQIVINKSSEPDHEKWIAQSLSPYFKENSIVDEKTKQRFVLDNAERIFQTIGPKAPGKGLCDAMLRSKEKGGWCVYQREGKEDIYTYKGRMVRFYIKNISTNAKGQRIIVKELGSLWFDINTTGIANEGGIKFKNAKKPEKLLSRIVEMSTEAGDIVLDYHLGSGTTAAVAHKMGRRYIGVEQMDYVETVAVERLKKVVGVKSADGMFDKVECDQGGISKAVNWQGGGSFVYCELAKANQQFAEDIIAATTKEQLKGLWKTIEQTGFISYKVSPNIANEAAQSFDDLSIEDLQTFLLEILDKNLLYVPLSDIDDESYNISESDKQLNTQFYGKR